VSEDKLVSVKKSTKKKKNTKRVSVEKTQPIEEVEIPILKEEKAEKTKTSEMVQEEPKIEKVPIEEPSIEEQPKKKKKKKLNPKVLLVVFIILIPIFVYAGLTIFSKEKPKEEKVVEKPKKKKEKKEKEVPKLKIVDENSTSRPFAVMINNHPSARPLQSGLQDAYIIYEIIVEGGMTRYMALFLDQNTERIGSIRSSRHYYLDYVLENDAIYVHHGQSPQAQSDFGRLGIDRVVADNGKTGWRDNSLGVAYEHRLFTNIEKIKKGLGNKRTTRNNDLLLKYSIEPLDLSSIENSQPANEVTIKYSNSITSSYKYDEKEKVYKRYVNGKEHIEYVTKKQLTFKNIITYQVGNYTLDDPEHKGRQGLNNIGSGSGYYISEGIAIPIKWSKSSRSSQTKYMLENGEELIVNDGNTFIQIQPKSYSPSIS
jgi:hypothetical protein